MVMVSLMQMMMTKGVMTWIISMGMMKIWVNLRVCTHFSSIL
jgi:hypothetical protein